MVCIEQWKDPSRTIYRTLLGLVLSILSNNLEDSISNKLKKYINHTRDKAISMRQRLTQNNLKIMKLDYTKKNNLGKFLKKKKKISEKHKIRRVKKNITFYWCQLVAKCLCCTRLCISKDTYNSISALGILHFHSCFWNSIFSSGHVTRKLKKDLKNSKEL